MKRKLMSAAAVLAGLTATQVAEASAIGDAFTLSLRAGTIVDRPNGVYADSAQVVPVSNVTFGTSGSLGQIYDGQDIVLTTTQLSLGGGLFNYAFTFSAPDLSNDGKVDPILPAGAEFFSSGSLGAGSGQPIEFFFVEIGAGTAAGNPLEGTGLRIASLQSASFSFTTVSGTNGFTTQQSIFSASGVTAGDLRFSGIAFGRNSNQFVNLPAAGVATLTLNLVVEAVPEPSVLGSGALLSLLLTQRPLRMSIRAHRGRFCP